MGLRGPGAGGGKKRKEAALRKVAGRKLPWTKKGLTRSERNIAFLEFLPITKGILAGQPMKLLPGQRRFVERLYGDGDGSEARPGRLGIRSEPRGGGKTGLAAGLGLLHLLGPEAEPRGEVYSAAMDRGQAGIMFAEMEAIIHAVPEFNIRVNIQRFHKRMEVLDGDGKGSTYEALSQDARRAHGIAPSFFVYDELAQAKSRDLIDNLMEARGKRKECLGIIISTQAPTDDHVLSELIDDGLTGADPSTIVDLICAPEDADPFDIATIEACNPALDIFLNRGDVLNSMERARRLPAFEPSFRNLRLNQRVDANAEERLVTKAVWQKGAKPVNRKRLKGRRCYGALDLSGKHDLSSLTLAFPDDAEEPNYDILALFWTPADQLEARRPLEQENFRTWIKGGFIEAIPGPVVRYSFIAHAIGKLQQEFDLRAIAYDRWRIDDFVADMADAGVEVELVPWGQGFKDMAPCIEWFAELALSGRLRHGGNPVLTAAVANAILTHDPAGNMKFDKEKGNRGASVRIDGAVTTAMALGLAKRFIDTDGPSIYEERGLLEIEI